MKDSACIIVGIAGASGSGKTSVAEALGRELASSQVAILAEDSYYKNVEDMPHALRDTNNFDHPDALDHELLLNHLQELKQGLGVAVPTYDYATFSRQPAVQSIQPCTLVLLEGILLFTDIRLREVMDIKIFIDTPLDICLLRRLKRDIEERGRTIDSVLNQYQQTVRPMYFQFIEPSKRHADLIIPRGGRNRIAIDVIKAKMYELLQQRQG